MATRKPRYSQYAMRARNRAKTGIVSAKPPNATALASQ
jgi:hypothetical protein